MTLLLISNLLTLISALMLLNLYKKEKRRSEVQRIINKTSEYMLFKLKKDVCLTKIEILKDRLKEVEQQEDYLSCVEIQARILTHQAELEMYNQLSKKE